ncbi:MAG: hypothetical protein LH477_17770 [Nocardioides sp.]|nr:hypothetical protein [Nocardioides sp.]
MPDDEPRTATQLAFLAGEEDREQLAGDQMFVDLDLSHDHLPAWSELHIGGPAGAVVVVTDQPHNGCAGSAPGWSAPAPYDRGMRSSSCVPGREKSHSHTLIGSCEDRAHD